MTQRERKMAAIIGCGLGLAAVYWLINLIYLGPIQEARTQLANKTQRLEKLKKLESSEKHLGETWKRFVGQTLSFEANRVRDWFSEDLKNIVQRHGFEGSTFRPVAGSRISTDRKYPIVMSGYQVTVTGDYSRVVDLVNDIYKTPYLCKITEMTLTPAGARVGRNVVRAVIKIETPVLPKIEAGMSRYAALATPLDHENMAALPPARGDILPEPVFAVLDERNILREYMPPPTNTITIDNEDWKTVAVRLDFYWEGQILEQKVETIAGNSQKPVTGRGEAVEISGSYADGKEFGPRKVAFASSRSEFYKVARHTPDPEPQYVMLAINNQDEKDVLADVSVTDEKGRQISYPPMVIAAGQTVDVGEWPATQVRVTARYQSGKAGGTQTFAASKTKHTMIVPKEPIVQVAVNTEPQNPTDPPPDTSLRVTGLLTYRHTHEMIVTNGSDRRIIRSGEVGAVDGGTLIAVHPALGGVVQMPETGNYYIYPLGQDFGKRYQLDTHEESELASAIDRWTRRGLSAPAQ